MLLNLCTYKHCFGVSFTIRYGIENCRIDFFILSPRGVMWRIDFLRSNICASLQPKSIAINGRNLNQNIWHPKRKACNSADRVFIRHNLNSNYNVPFYASCDINLFLSFETFIETEISIQPFYFKLKLLLRVLIRWSL